MISRLVEVRWYLGSKVHLIALHLVMTKYFNNHERIVMSLHTREYRKHVSALVYTTIQTFFICSCPPAAVEAPVSRSSNPQISLCGPSEPSTREAEKWLSVLLNEPPLQIRICNNFLLHLSDQDQQNLSRLRKNGVNIEQSFSQGHACLTLDGKSKEDAVVAALTVEEMLCKVQKAFVLEERDVLQQLSDMKVSAERQTVDLSSSKFSELKRAFKHQGLWVEKVIKVKTL